MAFAAQLLDELMGRDRNLAPTEKRSEARWHDSQTCKYFLCGFCPHELFVNTRADLGPCEKIHDDELRKQYEKNPRCGRMGYEEEFLRFLQSLLSDVERRIRRGHARLALNNTQGGLANPSATVKEEKMELLTQRINELVEQAEQLGCEGKVEEAQGVMKLCEQLREERSEIELNGSNLLPQLKEMEVCDICGAFLVIGDAQQRLEEHLMGKQHMGYAKVRLTIENLKAKLRGEDPESLKAAEEERKKREKEREEREKEREKEREERRKREAEREKEREERKKKEKRSRSRSKSRRHSRSRSKDRRRRSRSKGRRSRSRDRHRRSRSRDRRSRSKDRKRSGRSKSKEKERSSRTKDRSRSRERRRSRSRDRRRSRSRERKRRSRSRDKRSRSRDRRRSRSRDKSKRSRSESRSHRSKSREKKRESAHEKGKKEDVTEKCQNGEDTSTKNERVHHEENGSGDDLKTTDAVSAQMSAVLAPSTAGDSN